MKTHTTNYYNTFIEVAEDCPVSKGEVPLQKGEKKTVAGLQFVMVFNNPYKFTSDEIIYSIHAVRNNFAKNLMDEKRQKFFSKGQACFRASPLLKRYGWGLHNNEEEKIALYAQESEEYQKMAQDKSLTHTKAMRSKKKAK